MKQVARILDLSPDRIYEYVRTGHIAAVRLTQHGTWRIPATELERLKGLGSGKVSPGSETRLGRWLDIVEIAAQFERSLSRIDPKDWAIWGLPDTGQPPLTSEAGLKIWTDRGQLVVNMVVEQDYGFLPFMVRLKGTFTGFDRYDEWRESLTDFVGMCWSVAHEIWGQAENKTGLNLTPVPVVGKGHLLNVPKFIYEFALDNYMSGIQPELEMLQNASNIYKLVPKDLPSYILAVGSRDEMEQCRKVTVSLSNEYAKDDRIREIKAKTAEIKTEAEPFLAALSTVIKEDSGDA